MGLIGLSCCVKEEPLPVIMHEDPDVTQAHRLPIIRDTHVTIRTPEMALAEFNITDDGGGTIIMHGVCWSTTKYPTTADYCVEDPDSYSIDDHSRFFVFKLLIGTKYYLRAFATNSYGTVYGDQISFTTPAYVYGSVADIDANIYKTVQIGTQEWMTENLKTTRYSDGSQISSGPGGPAGYTKWFDFKEGAFCWFNNYPQNKHYGAIYNWYAVGTGNLCPEGWHVPTDAEWTTLTDYLGGEENALFQLTSPDAFAAEYGHYLTGWGFILGQPIFWSATDTVHYAILRSFWESNIIRNEEPKSYGFNVRCLKN